MIRSEVSGVMWARRRGLAFAVVMVLASLLAASMLVMAVATRPAEAAFPGTNGYIAFGKSGEIYRMNADGSEPTQLTDAPGSDNSPSWSADGEHILFTTGRD